MIQMIQALVVQLVAVETVSSVEDASAYLSHWFVAAMRMAMLTCEMVALTLYEKDMMMMLLLMMIVERVVIARDAMYVMRLACCVLSEECH